MLALTTLVTIQLVNNFIVLRVYYFKSLHLEANKFNSELRSSVSFRLIRRNMDMYQSTAPDGLWGRRSSRPAGPLPSSAYRQKKRDTLTIARSKTVDERSLTVAKAIVWNTLPDFVQAANYISVFQSYLNLFRSCLNSYLTTDNNFCITTVHCQNVCFFNELALCACYKLAI